MAQEALKTQIDSLQWEINRLDAENRKLRESNLERSKFVDLESELALAKKDVANLTDEVNSQRQQLDERDLRLTESERKLTEAESVIEELRENASQLEEASNEAEHGRSEAELELITMNSKITHLGETCAILQQENHQLARDSELKRYQAVEEEQKKWEARENRLVTEVLELKRQLSRAKESSQVQEGVSVSSTVSVPPTNTSTSFNSVSTPAVMSSNQLPALDVHSLHGATDVLVTSNSSELMCPSIQHSARLITNSTNDVALTTANSNLITQSKAPEGYSSMSSDSHVSLLTSNPATSFVSTSLPILPAVGSDIVQPSATVVPAATVVPMYGNQLPPISRFTGEEDCSESGTFSDWLEQFEAVAMLAGWNEHAKLVNLTTRLRGTAYSFYRFCVSEQRSNYRLLVEQLRKRFTPVELTAIQSQRFHDRWQSTKESVDEFAQELKKLFRKAYFSLTKGGTEAEAMGQTVLANQFVSGLRSELKSKVVGFEGNLEQLLVRARFEEAKLRELSSRRSTAPVVPVSAPTPTRPSSANSNRNSANRSFAPRNSSGEAKSCFNCGMVGHLKKSCPYSKSGTQEAPGRVTQKNTSVANLTVPSTTDDGSKKQNVEDLRCALRKAELTAALEECTTTVHGVVTCEKKSDNLGPTITVSATVNGVSTEALVDTESPVTILSLKFAMSVLSQEQKQFPSKEEWKMAMKKRLRAPDIVLRSYGGERLNVLAKLEVTISQGNHTVTITTLVQKDAPSPLLLGTDVLSSLLYISETWSNYKPFGEG